MPQRNTVELGIITEAVEQYNPSHVFGLFSGGHDSLCACHIASRHPSFSGVIHLNTGIGVQETRDFVYQTCKDLGWPLKEYFPPESYESMVTEYGFPGPGQHSSMYIRLKERALRQVLREHGSRSQKIVFITGVRQQESVRRMGTISGSIVKGPSPSGRAIWVAPIIYWDAHDKHEYIEAYQLPKNQVVEILCMSGECLCGAFAKPGELEYIRKFYPDTAAEIDRITAKVEAVGKPCKWGERPSKANKNSINLPLCTSCEFKYAQPL